MLNLCGWTGAGLILLAYLLLSVHRGMGNSYTYQITNILGAAIIGMSGYVKADWPAAGLNLS